MKHNGQDKEVEFGNKAIFGIFALAFALLAFEGVMVNHAAKNANLVPTAYASAAR